MTAQTVKKHYRNQWDMSNEEFQDVISRALSELGKDKEKFIIEWSPIDRTCFEDAFTQAQRAFETNRVDKVVPIVRQQGQLNRPLSLSQKCDFLYRLTLAPTQLIPYGEWSDRDGFLGATPEVLFEKSADRLSTMALAGTSGKDVDAMDFLNDPKERREHQFVIDDIVERLKPLGEVSVSDTRVISFPVLNHLKTDITVHLSSELSNEELIQQLHPTPALGIYPRNDYYSTFLKYPHQSERGVFGAPWGIETSACATVLVAIRKWDWNLRAVQIFAGCGVVRESVLEKEFAEILKKIDSVKRLFFQD